MCSVQLCKMSTHIVARWFRHADLEKYLYMQPFQPELMECCCECHWESGSPPPVDHVEDDCNCHSEPIPMPYWVIDIQKKHGERWVSWTGGDEKNLRVQLMPQYYGEDNTKKIVTLNATVEKPLPVDKLVWSFCGMAGLPIYYIREEVPCTSVD